MVGGQYQFRIGGEYHLQESGDHQQVAAVGAREQSTTAPCTLAERILVFPGTPWAPRNLVPPSEGGNQVVTFLLNQTEIRTDAPAGGPGWTSCATTSTSTAPRSAAGRATAAPARSWSGNGLGDACATRPWPPASPRWVTRPAGTWSPSKGSTRKSSASSRRPSWRWNATQCGFCTPGFILSVYGFCLGGGPLTSSGALAAVAGNLCRCTGYASIKRALEAIVVRVQPMDPDDPLPWVVEQQFPAGVFPGRPGAAGGPAGPGRREPGLPHRRAPADPGLRRRQRRRPGAPALGF